MTYADLNAPCWRSEKWLRPFGQLREITQLVDAGAIRPVVDKGYPLASTNEALAHVEGGRAQGTVVVSMR